jgi:hypothetical protein
MPANRDPDDNLVVLFKYLAIKNEVKSREEGREVFDDMEVCEIRAPGFKDIKVYPATAFARWLDDPWTGEQTKQSYAERFSHQYRQFKARATQTKTGTPLEHAPFYRTDAALNCAPQNVWHNRTISP